MNKPPFPLPNGEIERLTDEQIAKKCTKKILIATIRLLYKTMKEKTAELEKCEQEKNQNEEHYEKRIGDLTDEKRRLAERKHTDANIISDFLEEHQKHSDSVLKILRKQ
jgi:hypothetical protein